MPKNLKDLQLKEVSQLTRVCWAIWLERIDEWEVLASYKSNLQQRAVLLKYILTPPVEAWLNRALTGKRGRSRLISQVTGMPGHKLYVFTDQVTQRVILVGTDELSDAAQRFWRVVALGNSARSSFDLATAPTHLNIDLVPYHLRSALDRILGTIMQTSTRQGGWLAIRFGNYLEIKVDSNCTDCKDIRLSIDANPLLREPIQSRQARIIMCSRKTTCLCLNLWPYPGKCDFQCWTVPETPGDG